MKFSPKRLTEVRKSLGINKSEAARRLNMSAMGYGRYESGDRTPSYQTLCFIAQTFGTTVSYLSEETADPAPDTLLITREDAPLFELVEALQNSSDTTLLRITEYLRELQKQEK